VSWGESAMSGLSTNISASKFVCEVFSCFNLGPVPPVSFSLKSIVRTSTNWCADGDATLRISQMWSSVVLQAKTTTSSWMYCTSRVRPLSWWCSSSCWPKSAESDRSAKDSSRRMQTDYTFNLDSWRTSLKSTTCMVNKDEFVDSVRQWSEDCFYYCS